MNASKNSNYQSNDVVKEQTRSQDLHMVRILSIIFYHEVSHTSYDFSEGNASGFVALLITKLVFWAEESDFSIFSQRQMWKLRFLGWKLK